MGPTFPKRLNALTSPDLTAAATDISTAKFLSDIVPTGTTHVIVQAVTGPLYIRVGATASATNYSICLAAGGMVELPFSNFDVISVFGTRIGVLPASAT